ncbi:MAG: hypothetical protein JNJ91_00740 [Flavobacteriales bacterium]|nr:hypothetical protein [Flavobacteriales bacterium]
MDTKEYVIRLNGLDLGQVIDGQEARATAWNLTATYLETGEAPDGYVIEECSDAEEARRLAEHYQRILASLIQQQTERRDR